MKSHSVTKGKMAAGITGICLATLLIIFAFTGRYAEGGYRQFGNFFLGTFGMAFYGIMAAVIVICSFVLAGKSVKIPAKYAVFFALTFVSVVLIVHTLTTTFLPADDFSRYVQLVYNYYDQLMGVPTFGGVVFGIVCWGLSHVLSVYGAMILFVVLLGVSVFFVGDFFYAYSTGKITLQASRAQNDLEPSEETVSVTPVQGNSPDDERERARRFLFDNQSYPEEVSSAPLRSYDVAQQSSMDRPAPNDAQAQAASILFGDGAASQQQQNARDGQQQEQQPQQAQQQQGGNSFFRPSQNSSDDPFIVRGYYNDPQTQQNDGADENNSSDWIVSSNNEQPRNESQPDVTEQGPVVVQADEAEPPVVQPEPAPQNIVDDDVPETDVEVIDVSDVVVQDEQRPEAEFVSDSYDGGEEQPPQVEQPENQPEPEQPQSEQSQEDENEMVAIEGETVIETSSGPAVQARLDILSRKELEEKQSHVHKYPKYNQPPVDLLNDVTIVEDTEADTRARAAEAIINKLAVFHIKVELADTIVGPSVTRYMFNVLSQKTRMNEFVKFTDDIKACVEAQDDIRIEAPVPNTSMVGIEVANKVKRPVVLRSIIESDNFKKSKGNLVFAIGQEITGKAVVADLSDMPHLLIAGATGSGKSVALNCLIVSLMYKYGPEYVRFVMVDPKFVELSRYNGIPHMLTTETITTPTDALAGMDYLINEMEARYQLFRQNAVGNITEYNSRINPRITQRLPYLVFIVDELADLMAVSKQAFESKLQRLAQKSRAAGIHIVLATQRPDVKTITGTIKANLPCRMALKVSSPADSGTIINGGGAEKLLGKGDMLFMSPGSADLLRVQGAYVSNDEIRSLVKYIRDTNEVYYDDKISEEIFVSQKQPEESPQEQENAKETQVDPLCKKALRFWLEKQGGRASIASIQRNLGIGFNRAGRIMDSLQKLGYVETLSPSEPNSKPLRVLVTLEELDNIFPDLQD